MDWSIQNCGNVLPYPPNWLVRCRDRLERLSKDCELRLSRMPLTARNPDCQYARLHPPSSRRAGKNPLTIAAVPRIPQRILSISHRPALMEIYRHFIMTRRRESLAFLKLLPLTHITIMTAEVLAYILQNGSSWQLLNPLHRHQEEDLCLNFRGV